MSDFEKLYTVDDIATMTLLTTRTIRTYLKDGLLTGRKVGGQWRFTRKDIERLFENSTAMKDITDTHLQEVTDFMDGVNTDLNGEIQICSVADYYTDRDTAARLTEAFSNIISGSQGSNRFYYDYHEDQKKARYTFLGNPKYVCAAMACLCEVWDRIYYTHSLFDGKATHYDQYRPSYPAGAIDLIFSLSAKTKPVVADIGAGTGKMSGLLIGRAGSLYAVEPNEDMRQTAESNLSKNEHYVSVNATAENTGLKSGSIDLIVVAEAYHWFDQEQTKSEFRRILRDGGYVILLWNEFGGDVYGEEAKAVTDTYRTHKKLQKSGLTHEKRAENLFGTGNYKCERFDNTMKEPFEGFLGGMLSASYSPSPEDESYPAFEKEIRALFDKHSKDGMIEVKITTVCFFGRL